MDIKIETQSRPAVGISESAIASALMLSTGLFSFMSLCAFGLWVYLALGGAAKATTAELAWNVVTHVICGTLFLTAFVAARRKNIRRSSSLFFLGLFLFCAISTVAELTT